jgi:hypothetical protein
VLGGVADAPEIVRSSGVTRVVVIAAGTSEREVSDLRVACGLGEGQVLRVEMLEPLVRLARL